MNTEGLVQKYGNDKSAAAILRVLDRAHPEYLTGNQIFQLSCIYERRFLGLGTLYRWTDTFVKDGVVERKELVLDDVQKSIENLVRMDRISHSDLRTPDAENPYGYFGYRLTEDGLRVANELPDPNARAPRFRPSFGNI